MVQLNSYTEMVLAKATQLFIDSEQTVVITTDPVEAFNNKKPMIFKVNWSASDDASAEVAEKFSVKLKQAASVASLLNELRLFVTNEQVEAPSMEDFYDDVFFCCRAFMLNEFEKLQLWLVDTYTRMHNRR